MRKVVLVSLDAYFVKDTEDLSRQPFMSRMFREGTFCRRVETVFPALTYPIHVTMVTGCEPARTGVGQNQPYQPSVPGPQRVWYWERKHIRVPTLFDAVKEAGGSSCSILWPVNCKNRAVRWCFPEVHPLPGENPALKAFRYGRPLYILGAEKRFRHTRRGLQEPYLSDYTTLLAADTIRRRRPDFMAFHLICLDEARHHHGTFSPEALDAIAGNDKRLEDLYNAIHSTPGMEDALLIAVSDHGQEDIRETINLTKILERECLNTRIGVQSNGMSAYFFPGPEYDASQSPETLLPPALQEEMGISRLYTRQELDALHAVAGPAFAAEAKPGVCFSDALDQDKREAATHGFGPGREADLCLFAVLGRGVKAGAEIPAMHMRDMGPTIAGLMGLDLPEADGTDLSSHFLE